MGIGDGMMTRADNFTPPGTDPERWAELNRLEKKSKKSKNKKHSSTPTKQNSDTTPQQQLNDEQKFAPLFAAAIKKIDDLESDVLKSKIEVVKVLAEELEKAGFPVERIANEIVHELKGRISPTYIRRNLDDKYKDKCHSANAKKQKVATHVSRDKPKQVTPSSDEEAEDRKAMHSFENAESIEDEVVVAKDQQIMVCTDGHETSDTGLGNLSSKQDTPTPHHEDIPTTKQLPQPQQDPIISTQQQEIRVMIDSSELLDQLDKMIDEDEDIKSFWLCGKIEHGTSKLLDMVIEREQPLKAVAQ